MAGIHIKPSHRGLFTKRAKSQGHSVGEQVSKDLHSKDPAKRRQANFARMARRGFKPLSSLRRAE